MHCLVAFRPCIKSIGNTLTMVQVLVCKQMSNDVILINIGLITWKEPLFFDFNKNNLNSPTTHTSPRRTPLIALKHFNPFPSSRRWISCFFKSGGSWKFASFSDIVYSSWSIEIEKSLYWRYRTPQRWKILFSHVPHEYRSISFRLASCQRGSLSLPAIRKSST